MFFERLPALLYFSQVTFREFAAIGGKKLIFCPSPIMGRSLVGEGVNRFPCVVRKSVRVEFHIMKRVEADY